MRIALFHNLPSGGAKRVVQEWTRRLSVTDVVDVYSLTTADHRFCDVEPYASKCKTFHFEPQRLCSSPWGRFNQLQRWRDLRGLATLSQEIADCVDRGNYDVVFTHPCLHSMVPLLLRYIGGVTVHYLQEPVGAAIYGESRRPATRRRTLRRVLDAIDPAIWLYESSFDRSILSGLRRANLLAVSEFTRQRVLQTFGIDSRTCYPGVDTTLFTPRSAVKEPSRVLSVGEMSRRKGFDFLIEGLSRIPASRRPRLTLACNRVEEEEQSYLRKLGSKLKVEFDVVVGLNSQQLVDEYNRSAVCVYAPLREPLGLVPLEAMACGTPVLGVAEGGVQETVISGRTGTLVKRDAGEFASALEEMMSTPRLLKEYGQNGRQFVVENWTWEKSTENLRSYLVDCASQA